MKVVKDRTIEVEYVVPETTDEDSKIKKIIQEISEEDKSFNSAQWISENKQKTGNSK